MKNKAQNRFIAMSFILVGILSLPLFMKFSSAVEIGSSDVEGVVIELPTTSGVNNITNNYYNNTYYNITNNMNYTNVAMTNQTNTFLYPQTIYGINMKGALNVSNNTIIFRDDRGNIGKIYYTDSSTARSSITIEGTDLANATNIKFYSGRNITFGHSNYYSFFNYLYDVGNMDIVSKLFTWGGNINAVPYTILGEQVCYGNDIQNCNGFSESRCSYMEAFGYCSWNGVSCVSNYTALPAPCHAFDFSQEPCINVGCTWGAEPRPAWITANYLSGDGHNITNLSTAQFLAISPFLNDGNNIVQANNTKSLILKRYNATTGENELYESDFTILEFGNFTSDIRAVNTPFGLYWKNCDIGACRLEFTDQSGEGYNLYANQLEANAISSTDIYGTNYYGSGASLTGVLKSWDSNLAWKNQSNTFTQSQLLNNSAEVNNLLLLSNRTIKLTSPPNTAKQEWKIYLRDENTPINASALHIEPNYGGGAYMYWGTASTNYIYAMDFAGVNNFLNLPPRMLQTPNADNGYCMGRPACSVLGNKVSTNGDLVLNYYTGYYVTPVHGTAGGMPFNFKVYYNQTHRTAGFNNYGGLYDFEADTLGVDSLNISHTVWKYGTTTIMNLTTDGNLSVNNKVTAKNLKITENVVIDGNISVKRPYYTGYDNSTQALLNVANAQVINITNNLDFDSYGISVVNKQNLTFQMTGDYVCVLSPEFYEPAGQSGVITFWIQKNGVDVAWSNSRYTLASNSYTAPSINYQFDISNPATDNIRFMWWSDNANTVLYSSGALTSPTRPSIPAVLINCQKVSEIT